MRRFRARIFALLAALVLLVPSGAWARSQFYCRMMGGLVASCCCGAEAQPQSPERAQELREADCCQRVSASTPSAPPGTRDAVPDILLAASLPVIRVFDENPQADTGESCTESTQAPLAIGPPLFVVHCALLS